MSYPAQHVLYLERVVFVTRRRSPATRRRNAARRKQWLRRYSLVEPIGSGGAGRERTHLATVSPGLLEVEQESANALVAWKLLT